MRRVSRRQVRIAVAPILLALMTVAAFSQSQSLGDVARENREKQAAEQSSSASPRVITNATLPKGGDGLTITGNTGAPKSHQPSEQAVAQQRANERRVSAQWEKRILQQERTVANLRLRVDRLKAAIRFADPNYRGSSPSYDAAAARNYNYVEARQFEHLAQLEQQLDDQKRRLEEMQEAARHAGMHTPVYDP